MIQLDNKIFEELSKKYGLHPNIIRSICTYPFIFAKKVIEDPDDEKDIMFHKLFRVKLKSIFKGKKSEPYIKTKKAHIEKVRNESNNKEIQRER